MDARTAMLDRVADRLTSRRLNHPLRVGIDGPCGAGKTTFANDLAAVLESRRVPVIRLDSDGFHNTRALRYRQGRNSARGYYEDAYDFATLATRVLIPLGPNGDLVYATKVHDLVTDEVVVDAVAQADPQAVVVFDCTFLQRGGLRQLWDEVIYLDVQVAVAEQRGVARDADALGGIEVARSAYEARYMAAYRMYMSEERPRERATIVVSHDDPAEPAIMVV